MVYCFWFKFESRFFLIRPFLFNHVYQRDARFCGAKVDFIGFARPAVAFVALVLVVVDMGYTCSDGELHSPAGSEYPVVPIRDASAYCPSLVAELLFEQMRDVVSGNIKLSAQCVGTDKVTVEPLAKPIPEFRLCKPVYEFLVVGFRAVKAPRVVTAGQVECDAVIYADLYSEIGGARPCPVEHIGFDNNVLCPCSACRTHNVQKE